MGLRERLLDYIAYKGIDKATLERRSGLSNDAVNKMGDNTRGTIGIVGPTRMDYSQVISVLNGMVQSIEKVLRNLSDGNHKNT